MGILIARRIGECIEKVSFCNGPLFLLQKLGEPETNFGGIGRIEEKRFLKGRNR